MRTVGIQGVHETHAPRGSPRGYMRRGLGMRATYAYKPTLFK
jgi:hypothetical protein